MFHSFEAEYEREYEKDRSYNAVRDLGTERSSFSVDLKEQVWVSQARCSAKLFSAPYVNKPYCTLSV